MSFSNAHSYWVPSIAWNFKKQVRLGESCIVGNIHQIENWFCESTSDLFEPFNDYAATASKTNSNEFIGYVAGGLTNNRLCCCDL